MAGRKRHSPEQIIGKLREADAALAAGGSLGQVCQRLEVSEATLRTTNSSTSVKPVARTRRAPAVGNHKTKGMEGCIIEMNKRFD